MTQTNLALSTPTEIDPQGFGEKNPFRKQEGVCAKCAAPGRIFYCWLCGGMFCWDDFKTHQC